MAAILCDIGPGDEVILPSYTFVSTANAFVLRGARPVFVDIRPDTLNIDETLIEPAITPRTKAVCVVHYAGVACEMDAVMAVAERHGIPVIEDAAQAVNAHYRGRPLGTIGQLGCYSFHETKNYTAGEGGALCVNDPALIERAEIIRDKGTNRQQFYRGLADKYSWVDIGSSYVPSEVSSAVLLAQLEAMDEIQSHRKAVFNWYHAALAPLEADGRLRRPIIPPHCGTNHHMYHVLLPDAAARDALLAHLHAMSVLAVFHYVPLHTAPMGRSFGYGGGDLPVTERLSARLVRLPFYAGLEEAQVRQIVRGVESFYSQVVAT
jgi:dTDP-4-amino-4,6-dideoxygalactose transaminase